MDFTNTQVHNENIPKVEILQFEKLEASYLQVQLIGLLIGSIVLFMSLIAFINFNSFMYPEYLDWAFIVILLCFIGFLYYVINNGFTKMGYAIREKDLLFKEGIWWRSQVSIPFNRIQHCEVKQGPIERQFDLAQLYVYTAGGSQSDLRIPGIHLETAKSIKSFVLNRSDFGEEE